MREQDKLDRLPSVLPWVVGIAALVLVMAYVVAFRALPSGESPPAWGSFGDYVGGLLNPLVSAFTLIVAVKVWRQQKTEMAETKKALEEQANTAKQQRKEQRFFDLLNVYYRTVDAIQINLPPTIKADAVLPGNDRFGKAAIHTWVDGCVTRVLSEKKTIDVHEAGLESTQYLLGYLGHDWQKRNGAQLFGGYLRTIESILTTASLVLGDDETSYMRLFHAQLSQSELVLIGMFLLLSDKASIKMRELCGQVGLLSNLVESDLRTLLLIHMPDVIDGPKPT